jgi:hypothetical protein
LRRLSRRLRRLRGSPPPLRKKSNILVVVEDQLHEESTARKGAQPQLMLRDATLANSA